MDEVGVWEADIGTSTDDGLYPGAIRLRLSRLMGRLINQHGMNSAYKAGMLRHGGQMKGNGWLGPTLSVPPLLLFCVGSRHIWLVSKRWLHVEKDVSRGHVPQV